jgi:hypothetical protein
MRLAPARDLPMRFMRRKRVYKIGTRTTSLIFLVALPSVLVEGVALLALRLRSMAARSRMAGYEEYMGSDCDLRLARCMRQRCEAREG